MKSFSIICILTLGQILFARDIHVLNLDKSIAMAMELSYEMRTLRENLQEAKFRLQAATNRFKTQVNFDLMMPRYTETVRQLEDSLGVYYTPVKQSEYSGTLEISQPLPTDGRIFISSGLFGLDEINRDKYSVRFDTRFGFTQPLEAFYSYNQLQSELKQAELSYELSNKQLRRAELDIVYEASNAFYNLVSASETEKIAGQTYQIQEETTNLARNKYRAGVIAEVEALQMEIDLAEETNYLDIARANRVASENFLKQLLTLPLSDSLVLETDLSYEIVTVEMNKAIEYGLKNRLEIREREIEVELDEITIKRQRVDGHITGSLFAYYDLIGVGENSRDAPVHSTLDYAWNEMRTRPGNRGVSLSISIPLWDWGVNRAVVAAARANLRRSKYALDNERVSVERDIRNTVLRFNSSLRRLQLLEKNVQVAEKSFSISRSRFANGDINSQALALDRQRLSQAYKSHLEAYTDYKLLLADLARKTFYDFEHDLPLIDEQRF
jgi:outer membrane protein